MIFDIPVAGRWMDQHAVNCLQHAAENFVQEFTISEEALPKFNEPDIAVCHFCLWLCDKP